MVLGRELKMVAPRIMEICELVANISPTGTVVTADVAEAAGCASRKVSSLLSLAVANGLMTANYQTTPLNYTLKEDWREIARVSNCRPPTIIETVCALAQKSGEITPIQAANQLDCTGRRAYARLATGMQYGWLTRKRDGHETVFRVTQEWFRHINNNLDNPRIMELVAGADGCTDTGDESEHGEPVKLVIEYAGLPPPGHRRHLGGHTAHNPWGGVMV